MNWESAFLAVGVLLGEPLETMRAALGPAVPATAQRLVAGLGSTSREARARALAAVLSDVAAALEERALT